MDIRKIEEYFLNAWPALHVKFYDGWILQFTDGYTYRANSILPIYSSDIDIYEKLDFCEREYKRRDLETIFKLTHESMPENIDKILAQRGYKTEKYVHVMEFDLNKYNISNASSVKMETILNDEWLDGLCDAHDMKDGKDKDALKVIHKSISCDIVCITKLSAGKPSGYGFGIVEGDHICICDIIVLKKYRGRGYSYDIINSILNYAKYMGVSSAYLQVAVGNTVAENLYSKLGFSVKYEYWYRVKH